MFKRGQPRPSSYTWRHQTLTHLMKLRRDLRVWCDASGHEAIHSPVYFAMFGNLPYDTKLKCQKCGSTRVGIEVKG
jgi:hypothetical protein